MRKQQSMGLAAAWVWVVGFFALVSGAMEIALGFMAKEALESK